MSRDTKSAMLKARATSARANAMTGAKAKVARAAIAKVKEAQNESS